MKRTLLPLLFLLSGLSTPLHAQDAAATDDGATGRVFGRVWHTNVRMEDSFKYMNSVREQLEIPQSPVMVMMGNPLSMGPSRVQTKPADGTEVQAKGTLFFLQLTPEVSLNNPISFELVGDQKAFTDIVTQQKEVMGPAAELIGSEDRYEVKLDFQKLMADAPKGPPAGGDGDAKGERKTISIVVTSNISSGGGDGKGAAPPAPPKSSSTYYRYVDGVMYSSRSKAVFTIDLPGQDSLKLNEEDAGNDIYAEFDLTQIPAAMKQTFWSALEAQASVFLQRFDDEAAGEYSLRRIIAEGRLELLKRVLFDVDRAQFSLNLSKESGQPILSRLKVTARENSTLASVLGVISRQGTQLASLQDESSPLVLSSTMVIPEFVRPFGSAFLNSLSLRLKEASSETPASEVLIDDLIKPMQDSITAGVLDTTICLRGNVKDGLIPCGAVRLESAEQFLSVLESVVAVTGLREHLTVTPGKAGDYKTLALRTNKTAIPLTKAEIPVQLHLAATGSWLWFTVGDDRGAQMLGELVAGSQENLDRSGQAVPLLVRFQLNQWLGETEDELSKVPAQWIETMERWLKATTSPKMSINFNGQNIEQKEDDTFTSYAAKAFKPEDSELELKVRSAEQELIVDAKVGAGLARFAVAQFLESQNRMFKGMNLQFSVPGGDGKTTIRRAGTFNIGIKQEGNK
ncbi:MAG: hypothetical protein JNM43_21240 [Planctomycetaceae bacterium]|nr:hypothetical protein [Planctomycetaceae bacterium]